MSEEIENLGLLIKFMGMTRSSSDHEALIALRKANEHLDRFKATWEDLLRSRVKITVVADPFSNLPEPPLASANGSGAHGHGPAPMQPPPAPPQRAAPPPRQAQAARSAPSTSTYSAPPKRRANQYAGNCHKCGKHHLPFYALTVKVGGRWRVECPSNSGCGSTLDNFFAP